MFQTLTARSLFTGLCVGAFLTPCNVYSGLKIGWSFNMSIIAALVSYGFWQLSSKFFRTRDWAQNESVYSQTTASAAASIISGGLVAPIPAYTLITGKEMPISILIFWVFSVSILGVLVAIGLRKPMLVRDKLVFPSGVATAETIKDIHSSGKSGAKKLIWLFTSAVASFALKITNDLIVVIPKLPMIFLGGLKIQAKKWGLLIDPSFLMLGFGVIMGIRSGVSMLLGGIISWGILGPFVVSQNWISIDQQSQYYYASVVTWTLWPGVGLMVSSSITSFMMNLFKQLKMRGQRQKEKSIFLDKRYLGALAFATIALALIQNQLFSVSLLMGGLAVLMSILLGIVSSRVSGETGIPPIGALGKVTQLSFGLLNPGQIVTNLMTANVTGGAAGQSSDLLHDLKAGLLLKVHHHHQIIAQCLGIFIGSIVASFVYVYMIPDPSTQLLTEEWPAPAVATWKSVAELFATKKSHFPQGAEMALIIGCVIGFLGALFENYGPDNLKNKMPSPSAVGLAFIIPAWTSITMFIGALGAYLIKKKSPQFASMFLLVIAAGFVTGESLAGVLATLLSLVGG